MNRSRQYLEKSISEQNENKTHGRYKNQHSRDAAENKTYSKPASLKDDGDVNNYDGEPRTKK